MALAPGLGEGTASAFPGIDSLGQVSAFAYSCHSSHWAGKVSRLPGASKGSPEVTGCRSCPRKGCSQTVGQSRKPGTGQLPGFPGEWEQEIASRGKAERQQAPEPGGTGAVPEAGARHMEGWQIMCFGVGGRGGVGAVGERRLAHRQTQAASPDPSY